MIKLNLGCGNKILEGWTNVDTTSRNGKQPDIISDIRNLDFPDNYADVVMSVHTVEHFYPWEVVDLLTEWKRVLKPGGKMIIECPDVIKACYHLMEAVINNQEPAPQLTYWPLYGDPGHKDPLMMHKWGWEPVSLGKVLRQVGMEQIEEKPAQYHLREVRDMRVECYKPGGNNETA